MITISVLLKTVKSAITCYTNASEALNFKPEMVRKDCLALTTKIG